MRTDISKEYPGHWKAIVNKMPDSQVIAIYRRKLKDGSLRGKGSPEDNRRWYDDMHTLKDINRKNEDFGRKPDTGIQIKFDI